MSLIDITDLEDIIALRIEDMDKTGIPGESVANVREYVSKYFSLDTIGADAYIGDRIYVVDGFMATGKTVLLAPYEYIGYMLSRITKPVIVRIISYGDKRFENRFYVYGEVNVEEAVDSAVEIASGLGKDKIHVMPMVLCPYKYDGRGYASAYEYRNYVRDRIDKMYKKMFKRKGLLADAPVSYVKVGNRGGRCVVSSTVYELGQNIGDIIYMPFVVAGSEEEGLAVYKAWLRILSKPVKPIGSDTEYLVSRLFMFEDSGVRVWRRGCRCVLLVDRCGRLYWHSGSVGVDEAVGVFVRYVLLG